MTFTELTLIKLALDKYQTQNHKCPVGTADSVPSGAQQYGDISANQITVIFISFRI